MKFNWNQFLIASGLFLLGYLTFNNPWFGAKADKAPAAASTPAAPATGAANTAPATAPQPVAPAGR